MRFIVPSSSVPPWRFRITQPVSAFAAPFRILAVQLRILLIPREPSLKGAWIVNRQVHRTWTPRFVRGSEWRAARTRTCSIRRLPEWGRKRRTPRTRPHLDALADAESGC